MSWAISTFVPSEVPPVCVATASGPLLGCTTNSLDVIGPRRTRLQLSISKKWLRMRTFGTESNQVSFLQSRQEAWEDPDDGSGSDFDEQDDEEEVDEYDLDFESDWEGEGDVQAVSVTNKPAPNKYEEDLQKGFYWPPLTLDLFVLWPYNFFIKNIENILNDEKDKYIFSL